MGLSCGTKCVQYLFFAFNFIFFALGLAVLGVGIYSRVENDSWKELINASTFMQAANLLIAAGVIVAFIGFLGCCGACKRWNWMLMVYSIVVIIIFLLEIAGGIYAYTKRETIQKTLEKQLKTGVNKNYGEEDTASKGMTKAIDYFQQKVKCCGATNPRDWKTSEWYKKMTITRDRVPDSCCILKTTDCGNTSYTNALKIYTEGCVEKGKTFVKDNLWLIGGVGVGIAVVQLLGIIFALCLCKAYKDEDKGSAA